MAQREEFTKLFPAEPPEIRDKIGVWAATICSIAEQGTEFLGSNDGILGFCKNMLALIIPVKSYEMILTMLMRRSTNVTYVLERASGTFFGQISKDQGLAGFKRKPIIRASEPRRAIAEYLHQNLIFPDFLV